MHKRAIPAFQKTVYREAKKAARAYPWRPPALRVRKDGSIDPYKILVSEIMLQQTQTARVVEYYKRFIRAYPTIASLAEAPLADVLRMWQGLGYNRRAKMLHVCAREVVIHHKGIIPRAREALLALPGIGPYTSGAVRVFAYNQPDVLIETNIRTVYTHHFFADAEKVNDRELLPLIEQTLDRSEPRAWYAALMDYGSTLKQAGVRLNAKSTQYTKQSAFEGSDRQIRGAIIRYLAHTGSVTDQTLATTLGFDTEKIAHQCARLAREGFIEKKKTRWVLAG